MKWIRYLIALVVGVHGLVYLNVIRGWFPGIFEGWMGISLVLGNTLTGDSLKTLTLAVWLIAGIGLICAGVTILFTPSMPGLWRPLTIGASLLGILGFAFFWNGQTQRLVDQGLIGAILSLVILSDTIAFPQAFNQNLSGVD